ncbi:MAG: hypothetical protein JSU69_00720 [Candidatus Zixiibacteriota bacterium]|nr:MAG: hypothetical protein JSU69_00720 [candidate division Zixibacteria bacterium]
MVFSKPSALFPALTGKIDWLVPLIIVAVIGGVLREATLSISVRDLGAKVVERIERYKDQMPAERYDEIMSQVEEQFESAKEFKWYNPLLYVGFPLVFFLVISGVCIACGNFFFGGKSNFWIVMNVVGYAALIGLLGDVVRGLMMLAKDSYFVYTGLGLLKPFDDGSFIYYLFRQVDIFSVWRIAGTAIGLGVIYKMKLNKFAYVLFGIWLVFIVIVAVLNMFTGGSIVY